jgi:hypothetical protein
MFSYLFLAKIRYQITYLFLCSIFPVNVIFCKTDNIKRRQTSKGGIYYIRYTILSSWNKIIVVVFILPVQT